MCHASSTLNKTLIGPQYMLLGWHADADLAVERPTFKSTAGCICYERCKNTLFAYAAKSKNAGRVRSRASEA